MRTALVIIAMLAAAFLATVIYHRHVVMNLNDQLQAEIGRHAVTASKLTACQPCRMCSCTSPGGQGRCTRGAG